MARITLDNFTFRSWRASIQLLAAMFATGKNRDGTPFHPDSGAAIGFAVTPTSGGVQLPDVACKYIILKNQTAIDLVFGFAAGVPLFTLTSGADERVNVENANAIFMFDATDSGKTFRGYAIQ
jgi:hypothetical protein